MKKLSNILLLICGLLGTGLAQAQQQTVTYRLNFFHERSSPEESKIATDAVEAIIGDRGRRPQKQVGMYPDALPAIPGAATPRSVNIGPFTQQIMKCDDAYAQLSFATDTGSNPLGGSGEKYIGCVFVSKAGIRSSIVIERYTRAGGSLFGAIIGGIRNTIQGDDVEWGEKTVAHFVELYKQLAPQAMVELIETPKRLERPDGEKVTALLQTAKQSNPQPLAQQVIVVPSTTSPMSDAIEARKNITSMGMTYHSVDQLQDAIQRKDVLAVELFVKAAGVRANARGATGLTSAEVAQNIGDQALIDLIKNLQ
jgi:hypothetical protein